VGRLVQTRTPESAAGTVTSYLYALGSTNYLTLQAKQDQRGQWTQWFYDGLDRVSSVNYSDGTLSSSFSYDAVGNLTQASNGNVVNKYTSYDGDGRVKASSVQVGSGSAYTFSYAYDLAGDLVSETYPSGRVINTTYDIAGRAVTVNGVAAGVTTPYVQQSAYWPHGALWYWQYGNNVWPVETYNNMLQPYNVYATVGNSPNGYLLYLGYSNWNAGGTLAQTQEGYGAGVGWNAMTWLGQTYSYDHMNRVTGVTDTNYSRGFAYDEFGNMSVNANTVVPLSGLTPWTNSVPYNRANNHLVAGTYGTQTGNVDQRGNLTGIGAVSLFYDGESRVTQGYLMG
jgi:YD repeat-containing protein